jgi:hypothetical protein
MNSGIISKSALDILERLVEARKFTKDKKYPVDTGEPNEQSKPYATFAAALSRPPRVTWGDPPHRPRKQRRLPKGEP